MGLNFLSLLNYVFVINKHCQLVWKVSSLESSG